MPPRPSPPSYSLSPKCKTRTRSNTTHEIGYNKNDGKTARIQHKICPPYSYPHCTTIDNKSRVLTVSIWSTNFILLLEPFLTSLSVFASDFPYASCMEIGTDMTSCTVAIASENDAIASEEVTADIFRAKNIYISLTVWTWNTCKQNARQSKVPYRLCITAIFLCFACVYAHSPLFFICFLVLQPCRLRQFFLLHT